MTSGPVAEKTGPIAEKPAHKTGPQEADWANSVGRSNEQAAHKKPSKTRETDELGRLGRSDAGGDGSQGEKISTVDGDRERFTI